MVEASSSCNTALCPRCSKISGRRCDGLDGASRRRRSAVLRGTLAQGHHKRCCAHHLWQIPTSVGHAGRGWWERVEGATRCDFAAKWVQSGDVEPHGLARGRRRGKECHSWWQSMRTQGREMNDDARGTIEDGGGDGRRGGEASRGEAFGVEGVLSVEAAGSTKAPRESRRNPRAGKETGSNAIQSAGIRSCKLDVERGVYEWMEAFPGGLVERGGEDGVAVGEGGRSGRSVESPFARYRDTEPAAVAGGSVWVCSTLPFSRY